MGADTAVRSKKAFKNSFHNILVGRNPLENPFHHLRAGEYLDSVYDTYRDDGQLGAWWPGSVERKEKGREHQTDVDGNHRRIGGSRVSHCI